MKNSLKKYRKRVSWVQTRNLYLLKRPHDHRNTNIFAIMLWLICYLYKCWGVQWHLGVSEEIRPCSRQTPIFLKSSFFITRKWNEWIFFFEIDSPLLLNVLVCLCELSSVGMDNVESWQPLKKIKYISFKRYISFKKIG